jgi:hypothetical protein
MRNFEYEKLVENALGFYFGKHNLRIVKLREYGVDLANDKISISISYKYKELQVVFNNGDNQKELNDFIFEKFPDYIQLVKNNPEFAIFQTKANSNINEEFTTYLAQAFDFFDKYYPFVFNGKI